MANNQNVQPIRRADNAVVYVITNPNWNRHLNTGGRSAINAFKRQLASTGWTGRLSIRHGKKSNAYYIQHHAA